MTEEWNEDDYDAMSEGDCCEHGVGFDEKCEDCEEEDEDWVDHELKA